MPLRPRRCSHGSVRCRGRSTRPWSSAHNPGVMELVLLLAGPGPLRDRAADNVPTGALAVLELDVAAWADVAPGAASLTRFVVPRELT